MGIFAVVYGADLVPSDAFEGSFLGGYGIDTLVLLTLISVMRAAVVAFKYAVMSPGLRSELRSRRLAFFEYNATLIGGWNLAQERQIMLELSSAWWRIGGSNTVELELDGTVFPSVLRPSVPTFLEVDRPFLSARQQATLDAGSGSDSPVPSDSSRSIVIPAKLLAWHWARLGFVRPAPLAMFAWAFLVGHILTAIPLVVRTAWGYPAVDSTSATDVTFVVCSWLALSFGCYVFSMFVGSAVVDVFKRKVVVFAAERAMQSLALRAHADASNLSGHGMRSPSSDERAWAARGEADSSAWSPTAAAASSSMNSSSMNKGDAKTAARWMEPRAVVTRSPEAAASHKHRTVVVAPALEQPKSPASVRGGEGVNDEALVGSPSELTTQGLARTLTSGSGIHVSDTALVKAVASTGRRPRRRSVAPPQSGLSIPATANNVFAMTRAVKAAYLTGYWFYWRFQLVSAVCVACVVAMGAFLIIRSIIQGGTFIPGQGSSANTLSAASVSIAAQTGFLFFNFVVPILLQVGIANPILQRFRMIHTSLREIAAAGARQAQLAEEKGLPDKIKHKGRALEFAARTSADLIQAFQTSNPHRVGFVVAAPAVVVSMLSIAGTGLIACVVALGLWR